VAHASWGAHPLLKSLGRPLPTVSSSDVALPSKMVTLEYGTFKMVPPSKPRPLTAEEIRTRLVEDYRKAALNAKRAGFDAVEVHAAHGYLLNQFFCDGVNNRKDEYGGSIENRIRILHEVLRAVIEVWGSDRVAVRVSPTYKDTRTYYDCNDSNPELVYKEVVRSLDQFKLAYLLLSEPRWSGGPANYDPRNDSGFTQPIRNSWAREVYTHKIIGAGGFTPNSAKACIEEGVYDAVAFGRWFIANPDLPERLRNGTKLNIYNRKTFYVRDIVEGYTDYPYYGQEDDPKFAPYESMEQDHIGASLAETKSKL